MKDFAVKILGVFSKEESPATSEEGNKEELSNEEG